MTVRVAAVDCGTNAVKLLVADLEPGTGAQRDVVRRLEITRLGEGVDRTGRIGDEALARTLAVCADYAAAVAEHEARRLSVCATAAARDAVNGALFADGVRSLLGVELEVLDGLDEARLSYAGAVRGLPGLAEPVLVVDIGGGSTELVLGDGDGEVRQSMSADVGSVRLTERHLAGDPPGPGEVAAARADVERALTAVPFDLSVAATVVGVSGSVLTVAAHALGLDALLESRLHGARLPARSVHTACSALLGATVGMRRALPFMPTGRADVIGAGALVLDRVLEATGADALVVSTRDVVDGICWSLVNS